VHNSDGFSGDDAPITKAGQSAEPRSKEVTASDPADSLIAAPPRDAGDRPSASTVVQGETPLSPPSPESSLGFTQHPGAPLGEQSSHTGAQGSKHEGDVMVNGILSPLSAARGELADAREREKVLSTQVNALNRSPDPTRLAPLQSPGSMLPKYGASIPIGGGKFVPVGSGASAVPLAQKMDFDVEKTKIEEEFTKLEEQLDAGTKDRAEVEKEFDALSRKAETLRRLQEAEASANRLAPRGVTQLAPVRVAQKPAPREAGAPPSMAVVHWKKVTKAQYTEYREAMIAKYGSGPDAIKSMEKIPNRILITAPNPVVMQSILDDEELDPRPEPYQLPKAKS